MEDRPEILYTPGEAARMLGISTETLVHWARNGWITASGRTKGQHRRYTMSEIRRADLANRAGKFGVIGSRARRQLATLQDHYPFWYSFADTKGRFWAVLLDPDHPRVLVDTDVEGLGEQIHYYQGSTKPR